MKTTLSLVCLLCLCLTACSRKDEAQATGIAMAKELERFSSQKEYQARLSQWEATKENDQARLQLAMESGDSAPVRIDKIKDMIQTDDAIIVSLKSKISALEDHH